MDRIERADRLRRERPPSAGEHSTRHCNDVASALEYLQRAERRALVGGRQASRGSGADDCSCAFREGQRSRAIDFPGDERTIKHIDFKYRNLPGGGRARVAVYGLRETPAWEPKGWTMLGEKRVDSNREDTDRIQVSRWDGRFRKLTVVVLDPVN